MGNRPSRDDVSVVKEPFETLMHLYWRTPSTEERRVTLPFGFEMRVMSDPTLVAREANVQATDINGWEPTFVGERERTREMYGGYAFVVSFADLREKCALVAG